MKRKLSVLALSLALALNLFYILPSAAAEGGGTRYSNQGGDGDVPYCYDMDNHTYVMDTGSMVFRAADAEEDAVEGEAPAAAEMGKVAEAINLNEGDTVCIGGEEEFAWFADYVNSGKVTEGRIWELVDDIQGFTDATAYTIVGKTEGTAFSGTFDGGGHTIDFRGIVSDLSYKGMFGYLSGAEIRALDVTAPILTVTGSNIGGIAGVATDSTVESCGINMDISVNSGNALVGGIVGKAEQSTITNCVGAGTITALETSDSVGGIVGSAKDTGVLNCTNESVIQGGNNTGGIVGTMTGGTLTDCMNEGEVFGGGNNAGGVAGVLNTVTVIQCANRGEIKAKSFAGGIAGNISGGSVSRSFNIGAIKASGSVGSMIGGGIAAQLASGKIEQCFNSGVITANAAGGIVGSTVSTGNEISHCYHTGKVEAGTGGGIVAMLSSGSGTVRNCFTAGQTSNSTCYPIASQSYTVTNCFFDKSIFIGYQNPGSGKTTSDLVSGKNPEGLLDTTVWTFEAGYYPQLTCMVGEDAAEEAVTPRTPYILGSDLLYSGSPAAYGTKEEEKDITYFIPEPGFTFTSCTFETSTGTNTWQAAESATEPGLYRVTLNYTAGGSPKTQSCTFSIAEPTEILQDGEGDVSPAASGVYTLPADPGETWKVAGDDTAYEGGIPVYLEKDTTYRFTKSS